MMSRPTIAFIMILSLLAWPLQARSAPPDKAEMGKLLAASGVPSVSIARIERGRIVWVRAWGHAGPSQPASRRTLYNVASLTKPISAETTLRAASAGMIGLDDPMARYWIDPDIAGDPRVEMLTPRLALTHRTGFPNWRGTEGLAFDRDPGTQVGYSGEGFEYLARYLAARTETPLDRLARSLVLRPAGMNRTSYTWQPWFRGKVALPADADGKWLSPVVRSEPLASDDLHTTASDYARFLISVARGDGVTPSLATERVRIHASMRETLCTPQRADVCPDEVGWGLGWDVVAFGDKRILWHTGADKGEFSFAYIIPSTGEGAVVLTNSAVGYRLILPVFETMHVDPQYLAWLRALAG